MRRWLPKPPVSIQRMLNLLHLTKLAYLHEPGVLPNLRRRYDMNEVYILHNIAIAEYFRPSGMVVQIQRSYLNPLIMCRLSLQSATTYRKLSSQVSGLCCKFWPE